MVVWPRDECEMEETKGELLGALAYLLLDLHFSSLLACLGYVVLLGERALCIGPFVSGGCPFLPSTLECFCIAFRSLIDR